MDSTNRENGTCKSELGSLVSFMAVVDGREMGLVMGAGADRGGPCVACQGLWTFSQR